MEVGVVLLTMMIMVRVCLSSLLCFSWPQQYTAGHILPDRGPPCGVCATPAPGSTGTQADEHMYMHMPVQTQILTGVCMHTHTDTRKEPSALGPCLPMQSKALINPVHAHTHTDTCKEPSALGPRLPMQSKALINPLHAHTYRHTQGALCTGPTSANAVQGTDQSFTRTHI